MNPDLNTDRHVLVQNHLLWRYLQFHFEMTIQNMCCRTFIITTLYVNNNKMVLNFLCPLKCDRVAIVYDMRSSCIHIWSVVTDSTFAGIIKKLSYSKSILRAFLKHFMIGDEVLEPVSTIRARFLCVLRITKKNGFFARKRTPSLNASYLIWKDCRTSSYFSWKS